MAKKKGMTMPMVTEEIVTRDERDDEYQERIQQLRDEAQWRGGQLNEEFPERLKVVTIPNHPNVVYKREDNDDD